MGRVFSDSRFDIYNTLAIVNGIWYWRCYI